MRDRRLSASERGFSLVEISASLLVLILVGLIGVDAGLLTFASVINDRACREAAKAASTAPNYAQSLYHAEQSVLGHGARGLLRMQPQLIDFDYHTFEGEPPADELPYVSATTRLTVKLPAASLIFGNLRQDGGVQFTQTYAFPLTDQSAPLNGHSWASTRPSFSAKDLNP